MFLSIRSCLVLINPSYVSPICPESNTLSQTSSRKNEAMNQMRITKLKENPLGSMKFDGVAILVLDNEIMYWRSYRYWIQPERVEGHFLVSSQNVVTIISTHNIDYFQDGDNDHKWDEDWFPVSKDDQNTSREAPEQQYQVWVDSIWDEEIWPSVVNFWFRNGNSEKILYNYSGSFTLFIEPEWIERYFFFIQYVETKFSSNNDSQFDEADESKPSVEHCEQ